MIKLNPKIHMANVMLQCVAQLLKGIDDGNWDFSKPNHVLMVQYTLSYYIIKLMGALADCCADIELSEINSKVIAQAQAQMVRRGLLYHDYNGLDF
ncbi:MAG: hypothetical protein HWD59_09085 [Coxiellaceae bacterium]|nr:MAG: hypothetical protein HWD59_09085 [Coxiellaceae bacterium]